MPSMLQVLEMLHLGAQTESSTASRAVPIMFGAFLYLAGRLSDIQIC